MTNLVRLKAKGSIGMSATMTRMEWSYKLFLKILMKYPHPLTVKMEFNWI